MTEERLVREAQELHRLGRVPEAIEAYQRALAQRPDLAECWFNLAVLLRQQRQLREALAAYQRALDYGISSPEEVHLNRGVIYSDFLRQETAAEQELTRALQLNPDYIPALLNLANLNEDLGRRERAGALYERILALDSRCLEALARYANLQPPASGQLIAKLREALRIPASPAQHASVLFALGRLLDGTQQFAAAFEAYTAANANSRASAAPGTAVYDRKRQEALVDRLIREAPIQTAVPIQTSAPIQTRAPMQTAASVQAAAPGQPGAAMHRVASSQAGARVDPRPKPIFICGMFRSGSTLIEQVLAAHPQVVAGGELDLLPRLATAPSPEGAEAYRDELQRLFPGATYVTDKRPDNFLHIGLIKSLFPDSRVVHTTRDPLDNCLSIYFLHLDHSMSYALDLLDIGHYLRQYRRLMSHWQRTCGNGIFEINYDSFVHDPAGQATRLFEFLGLGWDDEYLRHRSGAVKTASVWQVREPIYTSSSGRAANYRPQLRQLREYLSDLPPK